MLGLRYAHNTKRPGIYSYASSCIGHFRCKSITNGRSESCRTLLRSYGSPLPECHLANKIVPLAVTNGQISAAQRHRTARWEPRREVCWTLLTLTG